MLYPIELRTQRTDTLQAPHAHLHPTPWVTTATEGPDQVPQKADQVGNDAGAVPRPAERSGQFAGS
jgi:hypothetical protein